MLVAHVTGVSSGLTVLGGIPWVRTLAFAAGLTGNLMIFGAILGYRTRRPEKGQQGGGSLFRTFNMG